MLISYIIIITLKLGINYIWIKFSNLWNGPDLFHCFNCNLHGARSPNLIYRSPSNLEHSIIFSMEDILQISGSPDPPLPFPTLLWALGGPSCGHMNKLPCPLTSICVWSMKINDKELWESRRRGEHMHHLVPLLSANGLLVVVSLDCMATAFVYSYS